jgi:alpha-L-fucosidase
MKKLVIAALCAVIATVTATNAQAQSLTTPKRASVALQHGAHRIGPRTDADMQKWRDNGLGQFIHWGVYAIPGGHWNGQTYRGAAEWIRSWNQMPKTDYDNLYKQFDPRDFDAKKWARQAREMGVKYLIFTTKHHDGFCLWPSAYTDYTVANTPFKRDIVREIVDAYNAEGIDVTLYFSIIDWNLHGYRSAPPQSDEQRAAYEDFKPFTRNQLVELLERYPTVKGLWFDGSWDKAWIEQAEFADNLDSELRGIIPGLVIGSRFRADELGNRHRDANGDLIGDYEQGWERSMPETIDELYGADWDCVMTIPENQWGYHSDWSLTYVKKPYELIEMLVKAVSMNGNFVLNFGPDGRGNIRPEETHIATEIGKWMKLNSEAIYGCRNSQWERQPWGYYTQKGDETLYLTVFNQPLNGKIRVKVPPTGSRETMTVITSARYLNGGATARVADAGRDKGGNYYYDIDVPAKTVAGSPYVIVLNIKDIPRDQRDAYMQALT